MTRAIVVAFHKYQPYGGEYYEPLLDHFINKLSTFSSEYDHIYFIDSNWQISSKKIEELKASIIQVDPHLRYYDAYKHALPQINEDLILFMDNDMVVYKPGKIKETFDFLEGGYDVVSIYDTIGTYKTDKLNGKNKFCPYWFAARKELLTNYLNIEWGPVHWGETLSALTLELLKDGLIPYEWPEDKSGILFDGTTQNDRDHIPGGRGYYHIRAGSVPAVLLAYRNHDRDKFEDYIRKQPQSEYLRQFAWYFIMSQGKFDAQILEIMKDLGIEGHQWQEYIEKFKIYHGLV